ncbi:MAG: hypothetical protein CMN47_06195 [SAR116 cluster bacterium]|nr:hypothetical protein [SAR116 cluster bacterium]|tara:strand:+ start:3290 stop:3568 length:279 start_codon:yes stop_codon:yes gene_type:complete
MAHSLHQPARISATQHWSGDKCIDLIYKLYTIFMDATCHPVNTAALAKRPETTGKIQDHQTGRKTGANTGNSGPGNYALEYSRAIIRRGDTS